MASNASEALPAIGIPPLPRWSPAVPRLPYRSQYTVADLLAFSDRDFVDQCYRILLRRSPDPDGLDHYLGRLRRGELSKIEVLGEIRFSPEGMRHEVHVAGLLVPYTLHRWQRKPVLGPMLRWVHGLFRLGASHQRLQSQDAAHARELHEAGQLLNQAFEQMDAAWQAQQSRLQQQEQGIRALESRTAHAEARASALEAQLGSVQSGLALLEAELPRLRDHSEATHKQVQDLQARLGSIETDWRGEVSALQTRLESIESGWRSELAAVRKALDPVAARAASADEAGQRLEKELLSQVKRLEAAQASLQTELARLDGLDLQTGLARIDGLDARIRPVEELLAAEREEQSAQTESLDAIYAAFEDRFRGSRELILSRVEPYLDDLREAGAGTREAPVLDLGCGRGEWLELLRDTQMHARGVDLNRLFVESCRGRGFDVEHADVLLALRRLPECSVGAITSMHLVEHLPFETVIALLDEAKRVLRPGGLLLLETPNPENLLVGACTFYTDPTHRNPIPPETLRWIVEARGFHGVRIKRLTIGRELGRLDPVAADLPGAAILNTLSEHFTAAPDYAVLGLRP